MGIGAGDQRQLQILPGELGIEIVFDDTVTPEAAVLRRGDWMKFRGGADTMISSSVTDMGICSTYCSPEVWLALSGYR